MWETYRDNIESIVEKAFEKKEIDKENISKIVITIKNTVTVGLDGESGVVIAGFGEHELFPSCVEFDIAGILYSKILLRKERM
ncbi:MAG: hypothetical protein U5N56_03605 [Candidatus Marinimicrobia bacterium]|nr:hypothetical protein [Candidatus Neomarinimicrobiota bacterium]